jgi:cholesterol transport system auxiliary component
MTPRALTAAVLLSGCALMQPPPAQMHKQVLDRVPDVAAAQHHATTLMVKTPTARPLYDTTEMAYTLKPHQQDYFGRNEWAEKPASMIHSALVQTLRKTGYFKEVLEPSQAGAFGYVLESELLELQQDFTAERPTLRLAMRFQLLDGGTRRVIAARELSEAEPMGEKSPAAGVTAANEAMGRLLENAARFVVQSLG